MGCMGLLKRKRWKLTSDMAPCEDHRGTFTVYTVDPNMTKSMHRVSTPENYVLTRSHQICSLKATDAFHKTSRKFKLQNYRSFFFIIIYLFRTHKQLQYITFTIHYRQLLSFTEKKKKKKNKVHKNTIVYILTITRRLPILLRFYFHDVLEPAENYISYKFRFKRILGFVIEYAWFSKIITYIIQ